MPRTIKLFNVIRIGPSTGGEEEPQYGLTLAEVIAQLRQLADGDCLQADCHEQQDGEI